MQEDTIRLIAGIAFLAGVILVVFSLMNLTLSPITNYLCKETVNYRSMISNYLGDFMTWAVSGTGAFEAFPLLCYTNQITLDETSTNWDSQVASEIVNCWERFGEGQKSGLFPRATFDCANITFNSTNPNLFIDLMKVYSIVYEKTNLKNYDENMELGNHYQLESSSPFRFCLDSKYLPLLNNELKERGLYRGNVQNNTLKGYSTRYSFNADSKTALTSNNPCISFKEAALNVQLASEGLKNSDWMCDVSGCDDCKKGCTGTNWACSWWCGVTNQDCVEDSEGNQECSINADGIRCIQNCGEDKETCKTRCESESTSYFLTQKELESFINSTTPMPAEYNQSAKLYSGRIYISFKDYRYWAGSSNNKDFLADFHTASYIFPIGGAAVIDPWLIPNGNEQDHLVISYVLEEI